MYGESWEPQAFSFMELLVLETIFCRLENCSGDDLLNCENPPGVIQRLQQLQNKLDRFQFKDANRFFTLELDYLRHSLEQELEKGNNRLNGHADDLKSKVRELHEVVRDDASRLMAFTTRSLSHFLVKT